MREANLAIRLLDAAKKLNEKLRLRKKLAQRGNKKST